MSKEYGIDPEAINTFEKFERIVSHFGPEYFRFIRRYPKKWPSLVKKAIDGESERAKAKIIERLRQIEKTLISCSNVPAYNGTNTWIDNALVFHNQYQFDGIITTSNPGNCNFICIADDFDKDGELFNNTSLKRVERKPVLMAQAAKQLLLNAREIHFVDRNFQSLTPTYRKPFLQFVKLIESRDGSIPLNKIIYHTGNDVITGFQNLIAILKRELSKNFTFELARWPHMGMHNRFILTDIGGMTWGEGLNDDRDTAARKFDNIGPLSIEDCYQEVFMVESPPHTQVITGEKP